MAESDCVKKGNELSEYYSYNILSAVVYLFLGGETEKAREVFHTAMKKEPYRVRGMDKGEVLSVLTHDVRDHTVRCFYKLKEEKYVFHELSYTDAEEMFKEKLVEDGLALDKAQKIGKFLFHTPEVIVTAAICLTD